VNAGAAAFAGVDPWTFVTSPPPRFGALVPLNFGGDGLELLDARSSDAPRSAPVGGGAAVTPVAGMALTLRWRSRVGVTPAAPAAAA
jgi:hypothetical protein